MDEQVQPTLEDWVEIVQERCKMEKMTYRLSNTIWHRWIIVITLVIEDFFLTTCIVKSLYFPPFLNVIFYFFLKKVTWYYIL